MSDFFEEDEPIEEVRAAFASGERGHMQPPRDLNQRAAAIVGSISERWDSDGTETETRIEDAVWFGARIDSAGPTIEGSTDARTERPHHLVNAGTHT